MEATIDAKVVRRWNRYDEMHRIDHRWLDELPCHWRKMRLSYLFDLLGSGTTPNTSERRFYEDGEIPWVNTGDLTDGLVKCVEKHVNKIAVREHSALKLYPEGTLLIALYGATIGKLGLLTQASTVNQACFAMGKPKSEVDVRFVLYWLLGSREHIVAMSYGGGQPNISGELIRSLRIPVPPLSEQRAIAAFLDRETARIDALIGHKQRLIALLEEKRQAVISHAVTKGLDPSVEMRDCEVDWLGDIPVGWESRRLKFLAEMNPSKSEVSDLPADTLVSFVPMEKVGEDGSLSLDTHKTLDDVYQGFTFFRDGDVLIAKITPCFENGKGALANGLKNGIGFGTTEFHVLRPNAMIDSRYLELLTRLHAFRGRGISEFTGAAGQQRIPEFFINDYVVPLPPIKEQRKIVAFIDVNSQSFKLLLRRIFDGVERLQEYRTALISAAVTGQIDVREEVELDG